MPIEVIRGDVAVSTKKANPFANWPPRSSDRNRVEPLAMPDFQPSFLMNPGETIFTIGSCFARNVEKALIDRGFVVPARDVLKTVPEFAAIGPNILNNYGVPSIYNEIRWALDEGSFVPEDSFFEIEDGKFADIHLNQALRPVSYDAVAQRRAAIRAAYQQITRSRVVIITLGLTECWFDCKTELYLNTAPRRQLIKKFPDRFELHVLNFSETYAFLEQTLGLIKRHAPSEVGVILTVSPVPMGTTHRNQDVMAANMYSKSVLRAAAEEAVSHFDFVDYFPSFESVLTSDRQMAWEDDLIHVKKPLIDLNISRMVSRYIAQNIDQVESADELLARLKDQPSLKSVFMELEQRQDLLPDYPELALMFAEAAVHLKRPTEADAALALVPENVEPQRQVWLRAQLAYRAERYAEVIDMLAGVSGWFGRKLIYWQMLLNAYFETGAIEDCKRAIVAWARVLPHSSEPYRIGAVLMGRAGEFNDAEYMFRKAGLLTARDDTALALDYGEYLADRGRIMLARKAIENVKPGTPQQAARFEELMLRVGRVDIPTGAPRPVQLTNGT